MTSPKQYPRTTFQKQTDRIEGATIEQQVANVLGQYMIDHTGSTEKLDFYMPGGYVEVKGKYQRLSDKFMQHAPEGWEEHDCFVVDELSVRKALEHFPEACLLLYDKPGDRWFMAPIDLLVCSERVRMDRIGPTGVAKGKWLINLSHMIPIKLSKKLPLLLAEDRVRLRWKNSECIGAEVKEVA